MDFLKALHRHLKGAKLLVICNGVPIHRERVVSELMPSTNGGIDVERLPAHAPELNPVEYMWAHLKHHEIGNLIAR